MPYYKPRGGEPVRSSYYYAGSEGSSALDLSLFEPRQPYVRRPSKTAAYSAAQKKKNAPAGARSRSNQHNAAHTSANRRHSKKAAQTSGMHIANRAALTRWISIAAVGVAIIAMLVIGRMQYYELVVDIEGANRELQELQQDYEAMRVTFDTKMSDPVVEEYAVNVLHMQKRENSQTEYITLGGGEIFEITSPTTSDWFDNNVDKLSSFIG